MLNKTKIKSFCCYCKRLIHISYLWNYINELAVMSFLRCLQFIVQFSGLTGNLVPSEI